MSENQDKSLDILGLKPYGEAVNTLTKGVVDGAGNFLSKVCMPASEEFGLFLKDKVSNWRKKNLVKVTEKFENKFNSLPNSEGKHAHPRIATLALERASWADSDDIQDMWAGLLTSSCTENGDDDSNLIFINLLDQLTSLQAKILNFACEKANKRIAKNGLIYAEPFKVNVEKLIELTGVQDVHRLDRELDHLRSLELLDSGFPLEEFDEDIAAILDNPDVNIKTDSILEARITPKALALNLYARCQGFYNSPIEFFGVSKEFNAS